MSFYGSPYRNQAMSAYRQASETLSPAQIIVKVYDGAISKVREAKQATEEKRIEDRFNATKKATDIIFGLQSQLDFDNGGEISPLLNQYYDYILQRLVQVNIKNDATICDEIIGLLQTMRAAWAEIAAGGTAGPRQEDALASRLGELVA